MTKVKQKGLVISTDLKSSNVLSWRLWLLAAAFSLMLVACTQTANVDIPTASENQGALPSDTNPVPVTESQESREENPVGSNPSPTPVDEADAALVYAQCVRDNGYPEFPDPIPGQGIMLRRDHGMSFNDPRMLAAMGACQDLRPAGMAGGSGDEEETMQVQLEFAQCMRDNGVSDFPDPSPDSGGRMLISPEAGINPFSPTFQAAAQTCMANFQGGMMFGGNR
jgi:hypothetical protein